MVIQNNKNRLQESNSKSNINSNITNNTTSTTATSSRSSSSNNFKSLFIFNLGFLLGVLATSLVENVSNVKISIELMEGFSKETPISTTTSTTTNNNTSSSIHHDDDSHHDYKTKSTSTTMMMMDPFDTIARYAFERIVKQSLSLQQNQQQKQQQQRNHLNITTWNKMTSGGLTNRDRILLSEIYRNATSVFEYGLGESTYIADHVGVPRYAGIDSDPVWIGMARSNVQSQDFRFYLADIGPTKAWGYPTHKYLVKHVYNYQLAPLVSEPLPFDVYMVDGRFRFPCVLSSFLHASTRKLQQQKQQGITNDGDDTTSTSATANAAMITNTDTDTDTIVLLHDCGIDPHSTMQKAAGKSRIDYHSADDLLDLINHSGDNLCVFRRKFNTTNEQLLQRWMEFSDSAGR